MEQDKITKSIRRLYYEMCFEEQYILLCMLTNFEINYNDNQIFYYNQQFSLLYFYYILTNYK